MELYLTDLRLSGDGFYGELTTGFPPLDDGTLYINIRLALRSAPPQITMHSACTLPSHTCSVNEKHRASDGPKGDIPTIKCICDVIYTVLTNICGIKAPQSLLKFGYYIL